MSDIFQPVKDFEAELSWYTGAPEVIATNCCTNAITLCLMMFRDKFDWIEIPKRTYVSIAQAIKNVGAEVRFRDEDWKGIFQLNPLPVYDSARRFTWGQYIPGSFMCLSFHNTKFIKHSMGGGAILCDDPEAAALLRRMRFDGRQEHLVASTDTFVRGMRASMFPGVAAELHRYFKQCVAKHNEDLPNSDYPDLSKAPIFKR